MSFNPRDLQQMYLARDVGLGSFEEADYDVIGADPDTLAYDFPGNTNFKPSGFQSWAMLGPFSENDITVDLLSGEASATGVPGNSSGGMTWWKYTHKPGYPEPHTDFSHLSLGSFNGKTLYAYVEVESDQAQSGHLRFGSDGPARVWLNGTQVLSTASAIDPFAHQSGSISLVKGSNDVLVKVVGTAPVVVSP